MMIRSMTLMVTLCVTWVAPAQSVAQVSRIDGVLDLEGSIATQERVLASLKQLRGEIKWSGAVFEHPGDRGKRSRGSNPGYRARAWSGSRSKGIRSPTPRWITW